MVYFLHGLYIKYWHPQFMIVQKYEPLVIKSGCISHHVETQLCAMSKEFNQLEASCACAEEFLPFFNRKICTTPNSNMNCMKICLVYSLMKKK